MTQPLSAWIAQRVPAYLAGREDEVNALRVALANGDLSAVQRIAHDMKGTGTSYGFSEITEIGSHMEMAAKTADSPAVAGWISVLDEYLRQVRTQAVNSARNAGGALETGQQDPA